LPFVVQIEDLIQEILFPVIRDESMYIEAHQGAPRCQSHLKIDLLRGDISISSTEVGHKTSR